MKAVGAVGIAAAAGAVRSRVFSPAIAGPAPKVRLAWGDLAACHSPLGFGVAGGIYAKHNLDVELYPFTSNGQTVIQALATGKADAGAGLIGDWLKPLEQGFDVKLFVGSHGGCGRLFASEKSGVKDLKDLKGKTTATFVMGASPQTVLQVSIFKAGVDPNADVNWKVVPFDLVGETIARGEADAGIHIDPWAWSIEKKNNLIHIADTQTGYYEGHTCCVLGANGPFLAANKDAVRRLAEANIEIHEYTAAHPGEVAKWYADNLKPAGLTEADLTEILGALVYHNHPIGPALVDQIRIGAEDLKVVKVLDPHTDPKAFGASDRQPASVIVDGGRSTSAGGQRRGNSHRGGPRAEGRVVDSWRLRGGDVGRRRGDHRRATRRRALGQRGLFAILVGVGAAILAALAFVAPRFRRFSAFCDYYGPWFIAIGVWLALWELTTAKFGWLPKPFFSPPTGLLHVYVTDWQRLLICIGYSLRLWGLGFGLGAAFGYVAGVALGWSKRFAYWGMPILKLIGPVPATAWIPVTFY